MPDDSSKRRDLAKKLEKYVSSSPGRMKEDLAEVLAFLQDDASDTAWQTTPLNVLAAQSAR